MERWRRAAGADEEVWSAGDVLQMRRRGGMERFGALDAYRRGGMEVRRIAELQARIRRGMDSEDWLRCKLVDEEVWSVGGFEFRRIRCAGGA